MGDRTGFLEESPGVRSSSRLFTLLLILLVAALVGTLCVYLLKLGTNASASVIAAFVGAITAVVGGGSLIHWRRDESGGGPS